MATRGVVGKRRRKSTMQKRGVERRELLLKAAIKLLNDKPIEGISFKDIATEAGVPEGSAYHFYANKYDLFTAAGNALSQLFIDAHSQDAELSNIKTWQSLAEYIVERGASIYQENPAAKQLLIGGQTPPEIKLQDRMNDKKVATILRKRFEDVFILPNNIDESNIFFFFIEITDLIFSLSVIEHGEITENMLQEAKRAGVGYLSMYLPPILELRKP